MRNISLAQGFELMENHTCPEYFRRPSCKDAFPAIFSSNFLRTRTGFPTAVCDSMVTYRIHPVLSEGQDWNTRAPELTTRVKVRCYRELRRA